MAITDFESFRPTMVMRGMASSISGGGLQNLESRRLRKEMIKDADMMADAEERRGMAGGPPDRQSLLDRRSDQIELGLEATKQARERRPDLFKETNPLQPENPSASIDEERRRRRMKMAGYGTAEAAEY